MKYRALILGMMGLVAAGSQALELNITPGGLQKQFVKVEGSKDNVLKLTGSANVTDLALLRQLPDNYRIVDLSGLSIQAYKYASGNYMGQRSFEAGEIPAFMLFGKNISTFRYPQDVKVIGEAAFANTPLTQVQIPATVEKIGDYAFSRMPKLTKVTMSGGVELGKGVFRYSRQLGEVAIEGELKEIPAETFKGCTKITSIPAGVEKIGNNAYRLTGLTAVDLTGVATVGEYAFAENPKLSSVTLDASTGTQFGIGAFFGDTSLETLPEWFTAITPLMLAHTNVGGTCHIDMPEVGGGVLANAGVVKRVVIGSNVTDVQSHAFRNLKTLDNVDMSALGNKIPTVSEDAFSGLCDADGNYRHILLSVDKDYEEDWRQHPFWNKFNINGIASKMDLPVDSNVKVIRHGGRVEVESSNPLDLVEIYSVSGLKLFDGGQGMERVSAQIDEPGVVIVRVQSGDKLIVKKLN